MADTFVSSANILNDRIFEQFGRSFMYIKNNHWSKRTALWDATSYSLWRRNGILQLNTLLSICKVARKELERHPSDIILFHFS